MPHWRKGFGTLTMTTLNPILLLRNFENYNSYADMPNLRSEMQAVDFVQVQLPIDRKCDGIFWIQNGSFFALARVDGGLFARLGDCVFELSKDLTICIHGKAPDRTMVVMREDIPCLSVPYIINVDHVLSPDDTPFIEDEDFDFGLLLANISHSEERKKIMLEQP